MSVITPTFWPTSVPGDQPKVRSAAAFAERMRPSSTIVRIGSGDASTIVRSWRSRSACGLRSVNVTTSRRATPRTTGAASSRITRRTGPSHQRTMR